jgi:beta-N-acetylhexosaminidase
MDLPTLDTNLEEMETFDLVPFETAVHCNAAGIMMSHIRYQGIDPQWPASLSVSIAKDLLRDRMDYQGLVITDDLDMGAVKKHFEIPEVIGQIIAAQIDIALICHKGPDIELAFEEMLKGFGGTRRETCVASVERILNLKKKFNLS